MKRILPRPMLCRVVGLQFGLHAPARFAVSTLGKLAAELADLD